MTLKVKTGREYVLGGKVYRGGDAVEGVPDKFVRILTSPKGPLEHGEAKTIVDLPTYQPTVAKSEPLAVEDDVDPKPEGGRGQYQRRDMTAVGQTGEAKPSASSRPAPARKTKTSRKPKAASKS